MVKENVSKIEKSKIENKITVIIIYFPLLLCNIIIHHIVLLQAAFVFECVWIPLEARNPITAAKNRVYSRIYRQVLKATGDTEQARKEGREAAREV